MGSTTRTRSQPDEATHTAAIGWRAWPLADHPRWSWLAVVGMLAVAGLVRWLGDSWWLALAAAVGLACTLWTLLLPVHYEISRVGLRREVLGRTRVVPWLSVRAYQLRPTGIVLFQRSRPTKIDLFDSLFVPFPADEDEALCAMREHLAHATELPELPP